MHIQQKNEADIPHDYKALLHKGFICKLIGKQIIRSPHMVQAYLYTLPRGKEVRRDQPQRSLPADVTPHQRRF